MANLEYSTAALDTLTRFHKVKHVVFVEGPEDVRFWFTVFSEFGLQSFKLKMAGGKESLTKYASSIINSNVMIIVAFDLDLSDFDGTKISHSRIIHTYGYSIENSLCCVPNIANAIANLSCTDQDYSADISQWRNDLSATIETLIVLDVANRIAGSGINIPLHNAARFQDRKKKHRFSSTAIQTEYKRLKSHFSEEQLTEATRRLSNSAIPSFWRIRGHFLISAVLLYIHHAVKKSCGKKVSLSYEALFAILVGQFRLSFLENEEKTYLEKKFMILPPHSQ